VLSVETQSKTSKINSAVRLNLPTRSLRSLLAFMQERQTIYLKRKAGLPFPWTEDPVLRNYRLENVYREQDKETTWWRENWAIPYADHENLWFAACLFRMINWSPTLAEIGFPEDWNPARVLQIMEQRKARGEKVYTSAYMMPEHGEKSKARYTVLRVLNPLWTQVADGNRPVWEKDDPARYSWASLRDAHEWLGQFYGFGAGFLTYEIVTDLRHTRYLCNAPDIYWWANPGPGAERGICRLRGDWTRIPAWDQLRYMRIAFRWLRKNRDRGILPTLEMRDVEHSLCAYDKWQRAHERLQAGSKPSLERFRLSLPLVRNLFGEMVPGRKTA